SNDSDNKDETMSTDKAKGDEDEEIEYTTKILQVIKDAHVTLSTVPQKTKIPVTSSSHSSNLAAKFLNFSNIPQTDAKVVSPLDVHIYHEALSQQTPILPIVHVSIIYVSSPVFSTGIPQSLPSFTPPLQQSTLTPPPTTEAINPPSILLDFTSVFQFNNRVTTLEKEVVELKKDPLHTQVTTLVDDHLDARLGATGDEFMSFLSTSLTARITKQSEEPEFEVADSDMPQDQKENSVTQVEVIRKHGYGYLKKIVVKRADNNLYRFKEGNFPRFRINDIEDMLLSVVQNRLTNLSGDDISDFAITLRMFTRSLVIQKRVEDLQLGVKSY
nr:hypothetical protein [Tanacetum cinerariifolium]